MNTEVLERPGTRGQSMGQKKQPSRRRNIQIDPEKARRADVVASLRGMTLPKLIETLIDGNDELNQEFDEWAKRSVRNK